MKTENLIGALLALVLTSCATDSNHSAARSEDAKKAAMEAEKTAAMDDYNDCIMEKARKLDDGSSNASLIAVAVMPDCKDQFARYVKASGKEMDSSSFAKFSDSPEYNQTQITAEIIQSMRSRH